MASRPERPCVHSQEPVMHARRWGRPAGQPLSLVSPAACNARSPKPGRPVAAPCPGPASVPAVRPRPGRLHTPILPRPRPSWDPRAACSAIGEAVPVASQAGGC
eukprot:15956204-Heterocapsa_arctica.AAC.1